MVKKKCAEGLTQLTKYIGAAGCARALTREMWMTLMVPGFGLAQPWPLKPSELWTSLWEISFSVCLN